MTSEANMPNFGFMYIIVRIQLSLLASHKSCFPVAMWKKKKPPLLCH